MKAGSAGRKGVLLGAAALAMALVTAAPLRAGAQRPPEPAAAPAAPATSGEHDEALALRRRAAGFWQARIAADSRAQYEYLEPRERGRMSLEEYAEHRGTLAYLGYQVEDALIEGSFATVRVRVLVRPNHPLLQGYRVGPQAMVIPDRWVRVGGTWYRIDRPDLPAAGSPQGEGAAGH